MLVFVCAFFILPLMMGIALVLRWLMPNSMLVAKPAEPFGPRIWHLMTLGVLVAVDYWMMNPDLSSRVPMISGVLFFGDVTFLVGLPFLGRCRRLSSLGWSVAAWLLSVAILIPLVSYRLLNPPHS